MRGERVDANQMEIVQALQAIGCTVTSLASAGGGIPDLLVGVSGINLLMEVKDGNKPPSARKLTPAQIIWHKEYRGQVAIVETIDQAIDVVNKARRS